MECFQPGRNEAGGTAGEVGFKPGNTTAAESAPGTKATGSATATTTTAMSGALRENAGSVIGIVVMVAAVLAFGSI